jgi:hypothetical protein
MPEHTQWTHSDYCFQLATTAESMFTIGDRQSQKIRWNGDWGVICNVTRGIEAGCTEISHTCVSNASDGARRLWRSNSARTEIFFADVISLNQPINISHSHSQQPFPYIASYSFNPLITSIMIFKTQYTWYNLNYKHEFNSDTLTDYCQCSHGPLLGCQNTYYRSSYPFCKEW